MTCSVKRNIVSNVVSACCLVSGFGCSVSYCKSRDILV